MASPTSPHPQPSEGPALAGRTIQVVSDLTLEEQLYLYERVRRLKAEHRGGDSAAWPPLCEVPDADVDLTVGSPDSTVYLLFMEGSTRTRESLRNAGVFHGVKVNEFQAETSSFQKNETITDTLKMLSVYSTERSVFVIRSSMEGVCSWLKTVMPKHCEKFGIPRPAFVNAGDGRYSHPIGELVDCFSLLESHNWDRSAVHLALVGDLTHGRTAHSKVEGLKIFKKVRVDLVSPTSFAYPVEFRNRMRDCGFEVREFDSVQEYLEQAQDLATTWYFYRPQLSLCGDLTPADAEELRTKVTFRAEWQSRLPPKTSFFQTLPRDKGKPLIPLSFDASSINAWDRVANNAYFLHVVLLSMLFGKVGPRAKDSLKLEPELDQPEAMSPLVSPLAPGRIQHLPSFIEQVDLSKSDHVRRPERATPAGAIPVKDGLVVDHIGVGSDPANCWRRIRRVRALMGWSRHFGSEGVYSSSRGEFLAKGIMSFPDFDLEAVTVPQLKVLASIAPGCTVNAIVNSSVLRKYRLRMPLRIYNLPTIHCKNIACVSHPENKQRDVAAFFERVAFYETSALPGCKASEFLFVCKYCKWPHQHADIWADCLSGE
mmetsp:Transcript_2852/g.6703  ORF Transcript_2852/g.6703 Transcript_2852/m.6703 type:complete len:598 (-) Transcript_2852:193-1986(-)